MRPFTGFPDEQKCEFYNVDERFLSGQGLRKSEPGKQRSEARGLLRSCWPKSCQAPDHGE